MKVEELFKLLKREFLKVNLLQAFLDSIIFFLAGNLVLFLFSLDLTSQIANTPILAVISSSLLIFDFLYRSREYNIEIYEEKNPELREILRTARDNIENQNIASKALFKEVLRRSKDITSESIIPNKRIIQKIVFIAALSFLTVLSGLTDFQLMQSDKDVIKDLGPLEKIVDGDEEKDKLDVKNGTKILGDKQDIKVSDKLVNYSITGSGAGTSSDLQNSISSLEEAVLDVSGPSTTEDLELAKKYSLAIKEFN